MQSSLDEREKRQSIIASFPSLYSIVIVKANIPGSNKQLNISYFLVNLFLEDLKAQLHVEKEAFFFGADGPWVLLALKQDALFLKNKTIDIEENHPLGRFIDLDVYDDKRQLLSRSDFSLPRRKCWLCNQDAVICARLKTHPLSSLIDYLYSKINDYLVNALGNLVLEAGLDELKIPYKFGLVNLLDSGSHSDMNYHLMELSLREIIPYFQDLFSLGFFSNTDDESLEQAVIIGKNAETRMMNVTGGVNSYKGLIYILGAVLYSIGKCLRLGIKDLFSEIASIGQKLETMQKKAGLPMTFGSETYLKTPIKGVRGEVSKGLPSVRSIIDYFDDFSSDTLRKVLVKLIAITEDTVLLKRVNNLNRYNEIKALFANINVNDYDPIALTKQCVQENLSFGGSADLLIVAIFLKRFSQMFHLSITNLDFKNYQ
ncbi:MAG: citrate lyase holo-[acyl-carrier protein] synthase [Bacilli bacterium]